MSAVLGLSTSEPAQLGEQPSPITAIVVISAVHSPSPHTKPSTGPLVPTTFGRANRSLMNGAKRGSGDERWKEFAECTDCLGFESLTTKSAGSESTMDAATAAMVVDEVDEREEKGDSSKMRRRRVVIDRSERGRDLDEKIFPPLLNTLNENGRPIFSLKKVSRDGQLVIHMLKNTTRQIVRFVGSDGRVTMQLLEDDDDGEMSENDNNKDADTETQNGGDDGGDANGGGEEPVTAKRNFDVAEFDLRRC